jgi:hypothetical protein
MVIKTECWNDELSIEILTFRSPVSKEEKKKEERLLHTGVESCLIAFFFLFPSIIQTYIYILTQGHILSVNFVLDLKYLFTKNEIK